MIQVYRTKKGIKVRDGMLSVDINPSTMAAYGTIYPDTYVELEDDELVYTYNDPLKVGQIYPDHVIEHGVKDNMIVLGQGNGYCYRYINGHHGLWFSMGAAGGVETLPVDLYKVLYLGE